MREENQIQIYEQNVKEAKIREIEQIQIYEQNIK